MNLARAYSVVRLLLQHASSYAELGAAAAAEYRSAWARRIILAVVGVAAGIAGLVALWCTGLVALWDTPWRLAYVGGTALILLVVAGGSLWYALTSHPAGPSSRLLRAEFDKDMELFQEWKSTL